MSEASLRDRVGAVKEITALFRLERIMYVCGMVVFVLILLGSVVTALFRGKIGYAELTPMIGSSGGLTFVLGRLIHMWDRAVDLLVEQPGGGEGHSP